MPVLYVCKCLESFISSSCLFSTKVLIKPGKDEDVLFV